MQTFFLSVCFDCNTYSIFGPSCILLSIFKLHIIEDLVHNYVCSFCLVVVVILIIPLKKGIMFFTTPLGLSVCVSVCHHVCGEMAGLSNMASSEVNTIYKNLKMQH